MSLEQAIEFFAACVAVAFEWLEPKFTLLTVIIVLTSRDIIGISDNDTMSLLVWLHVGYLVLAIIAMYVNKVLVPREKINISIQCS